MDGAKERRSEERRSERLTERKATERKSNGATDGRSDGAKSDGAISLYIKIEKRKFYRRVERDIIHPGGGPSIPINRAS